MRRFKKLGTIGWGFSGGEAYLRKDLPDLISHAHKLGMMTSVVTNGTLTEQILKTVPKTLDWLKISLEGDESTHDTIRGPGSFKQAIETLKQAKKRNLSRITIESVLQDTDREVIAYLLNLAKELQVGCGFQPVYDESSGREDKRVITNEKSIEALHNNIRYVIEQKKNGLPVSGSLTYLNYLLNYGKEKFPINQCFAGLVYAYLMPDGTIKNCSWIGNNDPEANICEGFNKLSNPHPDCYCWPKCHGEYSVIFSLKLSEIFKFIKMHKIVKIKDYN